MAVVTEPPWLNAGSGVADRNGTTSHTIPFGFTSTTGSLLVFVVFGAVTHAASGWDEQLQPVSSGELSVFTKTSVGDSDITVTHNGSNFPVLWAVYELPAGSSYTSGTSSTASSDAYPALSGLPGTEQVIVAARGRVAGSVSETSASTAWSAPWVEDADLFTAFSTTDGGHLTVAHQINVTSSSVTPTDTPTYGGTWVTPDREAVTVAFDVAASAASGSGALTLPALTVSGTGDASASGTASLTLPALSASGTGDASMTGTGALVLSALTASGAGSARATGAAALILPAMTASGVGGPPGFEVFGPGRAVRTSAFVRTLRTTT